MNIKFKDINKNYYALLFQEENEELEVHFDKNCESLEQFEKFFENGKRDVKNLIEYKKDPDKYMSESLNRKI